MVVVDNCHKSVNLVFFKVNLNVLKDSANVIIVLEWGEEYSHVLLWCFHMESFVKISWIILFVIFKLQCCTDSCNILHSLKNYQNTVITKT